MEEANKRQDPQKKGKLWSPSKDSRVCSKHFIGGKPPPEEPNPTINLGYDAREKIKRMTPTPIRRKFERTSQSSLCRPRPMFQNEDIPSGNRNVAFTPSQYDNGERCAQNRIFQLAASVCVQAVFFMIIQASMALYLGNRCVQLSTKLSQLESKNEKSQLEIARLKEKVRRLEKTCSCSKPLSEIIITENNVRFYTNFTNMKLFHAIHEAVAPLVKRKWKGIKFMSSKVTRKFAASSQKFGPSRKLQSRD